MKLTIIHHSDLLGGASRVTFRFMKAMRALGIDARMLVYTRLSDSGNVRAVGTRFQRLMRYSAERARVRRAVGSEGQTDYPVSVGLSGFPLWKHPWVREADVIHLGSIDRGLLSLEGIRRVCALGKPVFWTLDDLWSFSGFCHENGGCTRYEEGCGNCPLIRDGSDVNDLSSRMLKRKKALFELPNLYPFATSHWMRLLAKRSSVLRDRDIQVIPPIFPVGEFYTEPIEGYPAFDPIKNRRRIIIGGHRLDAPRKRLDLAIEALNVLFDERPDIANNTGAILFGEINEAAMLDRLRFPSLYMGPVSDSRLIHQLYASGNVVLSSSKWEVVGTTLVEGLAAGCLPVTFGGGGERDVVSRPGVNGYIAENGNARSLAENLALALEATPDRQALHDDAMERFGAASIAARYAEAYRDVLKS